MAVKAVALEADLLDTVLTRVRDRFPESEAPAVERFVRQYYRWVPAEDLADRSPLDLYGAAVAHWKEMLQRQPGEIKVHVFNPDIEQHGWQSTHTVVEIVTDDMPFLVDSVTMELARQGHPIHLVIHPVIEVRRDEQGHLVDVLETGHDDGHQAVPESVLHAEVAREPDRAEREQLRADVERVLREVHAAVHDWHAMRGRA